MRVAVANIRNAADTASISYLVIAAHGIGSGCLESIVGLVGLFIASPHV